MDDRPPAPAEVSSTDPIATAALAPAPAQGSFQSIDEVKTQLNKNPDAKALLDAASRDGVQILSADTRTGGKFDPVNKIIRIDPNRTTDLNDATSALLYELLRYKYSKDQLNLDKQAKAGTLTADQYATECERISYEYMQEHHAIAAKAVQAGNWAASTDTYGRGLTPPRSYSTFDKYLAVQKTNGHYQNFLNRWQSLQP
jgi:hypothetical protein